MFIYELKGYNIRFVKGVGEKRASLLHKLNIFNLYDLLNYFPFRYEDRRQVVKIIDLQEGVWQTIEAEVIGYDFFKGYNKRKVLKIIVSDKTSYLSLICYNRDFLKNILKKGTKVFISSNKFVYKFNEFQTAEFDYEIIDKDDDINIHTRRIVPIYHLTENITMKYLRKLIYQQLHKNLSDIEDYLPDRIKKKYNLPEYKNSLYKIHFPSNFKEKDIARKRLAFDKLFLIELNLAREKKKIVSVPKKQKYVNDKLGNKFIESLPFNLTEDQIKSIAEIKDDMKSDKIMNRLLMGDVGSGKTLVALITSLLAVENNYQVAFMVPTEILAVQHYNNIKKLLKDFDIDIFLLTGKQKLSEKREIQEKILENKKGIIIGTHALIQDDIEFNNLAYIIIDEQHRFGVKQRAKLHLKGNSPDVLVMTATPIPRTLSLTIYGDLDISLIKTMPPGRKDIITKWFSHSKIEKVYQFLRSEMEKKHQVYVVYPLVKESEKLDLKAAEEMYREFKDKIFKDFKVGMIHGKLKKEEKDKVMSEFREGKIDLLVSTTVIEVGVDVANATVMVIEHAERFGLAQLHQLRGRIGRSDLQSYCILLTSDRISEDTKKRMKAMVKYSDGFKLAEIDLELRGPGEIMGTRQSGMPDLAPADLLNDLKILEFARKEAFEIVEENPDLDKYKPLREYLKNEFYSDDLNYIKIS